VALKINQCRVEFIDQRKFWKGVIELVIITSIQGKVNQRQVLYYLMNLLSFLKVERSEGRGIYETVPSKKGTICLF
jgi:hypothetical protein